LKICRISKGEKRKIWWKHWKIQVNMINSLFEFIIDYFLIFFLFLFVVEAIRIKVNLSLNLKCSRTTIKPLNQLWEQNTLRKQQWLKYMDLMKSLLFWRKNKKKLRMLFLISMLMTQRLIKIISLIRILMKLKLRQSIGRCKLILWAKRIHLLTKMKKIRERDNWMHPKVREELKRKEMLRVWNKKVKDLLFWREEMGINLC